MLSDRKVFMKEFKKRMKQFKRQVVCSQCERQPYPGENIDDWRIEKSSDNIDLICTDCFEPEGTEVYNDV